ncbi:MAG: lysylphosphatidylglycerol synthase transmembrane domain-containing protein [bacterium]
MKLKVAIGIVISAVFIFLAFRQIDVDEMLGAFQKVHYVWLIPAFLAMLLSHWIRAVRWGYFVEPVKNASLTSLFSAVMIGYAANNVFPLRLGEFLRAFALGKSEGISKSSAFATVIVERLVDILCLLVLLSGTILIYPLPQEIKNAGYLIFSFTLAGIVFLLFLMNKTEATTRLLSRIMPKKIFSFVEKILKSFIQGFFVLKKSEHYLKITFTSITIWLLYAVVLYFIFIAFDFDENYHINFISGFVVLVTVSIGIMIPSSPGFVGTYHWFCMQSLAFFGIPQSEAFSFSVISHALNTVPFTIIGFYYFGKYNLHFSDAVMEKEAVEHDVL